MRVADRLSVARQRQFVGREDELALFTSVLNAEFLPFCVLFVYGPGGVGKSTLLQTLLGRCHHAAVPATLIDARDIDPTPEVFTAAIRRALRIEAQDDGLGLLSTTNRRYVLLIDTFELLAPLEDWLCDQFLPYLSEQVLVVFGSRLPPSSTWRADAGWQSLMHMLPLRNLRPDESRRYLTQRGLPQASQEQILSWTHGHPLALSLVADVYAQRHDAHFLPITSPDVIKTLLERLVQKVPGPAHRTALEACALVRRLTEPLLAEMMEMTDVHELWQWLRGLSFVTAGELGLFPHDLTREALVADLRWRNPDWYAELHNRARGYYARSLQQTHGQAQQRVMFDYVFLHRENPLVRPFLEWQETGAGSSSRMTEQDIGQLVAMVARHEGVIAAHFATRWIAVQPESVTVYRDTEHQPAGMLIALDLVSADPTARDADPATAAAWRFLQRSAPLRPGERAIMFRYWMARDTYQAVSAIQSMIFVNIAQYYMNTAGLAYSFFTCADPEFWAPPFAYMDLMPLPEVRYTVGEHTYGVFGHDWRSVPPLAWLDLLAARELDAAPLEQQPTTTMLITVLSQADFALAVREALRDWTRPELLRANPLSRSRLILDRVGPNGTAAERAAELQALLRRAVDTLQATPRTVKLFRALYHSYFQPGQTQEQVAELLDVPFSSYRRHLKEGISQVCTTLWDWELHGVGVESDAVLAR